MNNPHPYRKFEKPTTIVEEGIQAANLFYDSIGQSWNKTERTMEHTMPRMAIGVALAKRIGYPLTAKVLDKDRSTLNHYGNIHERNLVSWDGYEELYEIADHVVTTHFDGYQKLERLEYINAKVGELLTEKFLIQTSLYEQLQIQNHQHSREAVR